MTPSPRVAHLAYYAAHVGKSLLWTASDLVTIYALVTVYRIEPALAGGLFLGGLAANAIADLAVGSLLDGSPGRAPLVAMSGLSLAALAFPLTILGAATGPVVVVTATLVFRVAYAAYDVPHNAMMSRLGDTPARAARLARGRTLGSGAAAMMVATGLRAAPAASGVRIFLLLLAVVALTLGTALLPLLAQADRRAAGRPALAGAVVGGGLPRPFLVGSVLGIVALGALAKATLHLPRPVPAWSAGAILMMLTLGRMGAALLPFSLGAGRRGMALLAAAHGAAALVVLSFAVALGPVSIVALGVMMGTTNQIEWALMPSLARGARSYGLFTMASKLALGAAGLLMTAALEASPILTTAGWHALVGGVAGTCLVAAVVVTMRPGPPPLPATSRVIR